MGGGSGRNSSGSKDLFPWLSSYLNCKLYSMLVRLLNFINIDSKKLLDEAYSILETSKN